MTHSGPQGTSQGTNGRDGGTATALESVRRLEASLESRRVEQMESEARVERAREEARSIVARALEEARREARECAEAVLDEAEAEAREIEAEARAEAGTLRALAEGDRPRATAEVVQMVLPAMPVQGIPGASGGGG